MINLITRCARLISFTSLLGQTFQFILNFHPKKIQCEMQIWCFGGCEFINKIVKEIFKTLEIEGLYISRPRKRNSIHSREGWTAIGIRCTPLLNYVELFWNSLDNAPPSIVFYLKMKVKVGVHDIRSRFTPRQKLSGH